MVTDINLDQPDRRACGRPSDLQHRGRTPRRGSIRASTTLPQVQSIGDSTFKSMTLQVNKRFAHGLTFNVQYSLGKGLDNTPLLTQLTVQAETGRSDPSNIDRDLGPNPLDMRHSFNGNVVYSRPTTRRTRSCASCSTATRSACCCSSTAGCRSTSRANRDLNGDGVSSDRPLFVARNSLYSAARKNVDLRYTRSIPLHGSVRGEVIAEMKNVFNTEQLSGITTTRPSTRSATRRARFRPIRTSSRTRRATSSASSSWDSRCDSRGQAGG